MLHGTGRPPRAKPPGYAGEIAGIPRAGIPNLYLADGPNGVGNGSRGVTAFPAPIAVAASFDDALARRQGTALGAENRDKGNDVALSPTVNIVRLPQWGRAFESFGEDPFLASGMAGAVIGGIQSTGVMASVKHFAVNSQEHGRTLIDAQIGERTLREIYLPAFKSAVDAGVLTVMCAYNRVNGAYACENRPLLDDILKKEWGFRGVVVSDWAASHSTVASAVNGLDLEMPFGPLPDYPTYFGSELEAAVRDGKVPMARIDDMAKRVVYTMIASGRLDRSAKGDRNRPAATVEHTRLAQELAEAGTVMLRNERNLLPLDAKKIRSIAIIGVNGDAAAIGTGTGQGSASVLGDPIITPLAAISARAGKSVAVTFAKGTAGTAALPPMFSDWTGQYFAASDFTGAPMATLREKAVRFTGTPLAQLKGKWSARWTSTFIPPASGPYRFSLDTAGVSRLYVDDKEVLGNFGQDRSAVAHAVVDLPAGRPVRIRLDYVADLLLKREIKVALGMLPPDPGLLADAVETATKADVAIVFASDLRVEGGDQPSLALPGDQDRLIVAIAKANPHTIVVLNTGGPALMPWNEQVGAVLEAWYPGQANGVALAAVLFGDVNPSGRLPMTFPVSDAQSATASAERWPGVGNVSAYDEGLLVGYRWYDARKLAPLYPFGHGLSYTSFTYKDLTVGRRGSGYQATVSITNTGRTAGSEVVQLYLTAPADAAEPPRQLKAYRRVSLQPGKSSVVDLIMPKSSFEVWDEKQHDWRVAAGRWTVATGSSSRDIRAETSLQVQK